VSLVIHHLSRRLHIIRIDHIKYVVTTIDVRSCSPVVLPLTSRKKAGSNEVCAASCVRLPGGILVLIFFVAFVPSWFCLFSAAGVESAWATSCPGYVFVTFVFRRRWIFDLGGW